MKQTLWQRLTGQPDADAPRPPAVRGTTIVREERGSGAGAVLFRPYAVAEFIPDDSSDTGPIGGLRPSAVAPPPAPAEAVPASDAPSPEPAPARAGRTANPVADDWRRGNPDMFRTVARRFCARAPVVARELREYCLTNQRQRLARLAASLKPTLGLYDMTAADAAERVERVAADAGQADLAQGVLALEDEVWRVAGAWQDVDQPPPAASVEVRS